MPFILPIVFILFFHSLNSQNLYFPPLNGNTWETTDPASLGWCPEHITGLYDFLDTEESKAFIVLKDGKIVLEKYFDQFTRDSFWYWASSGKTLTAFLIGLAQQEGFLKTTDQTSKYLGKGWTKSPPNKEDLITVWHQLTMTSGLDDGVPESNCTLPDCLIYKADAGDRWTYHNAPYTLLRDVIEKATGMNENTYTQSRLKSKTGMNGLWVSLGYDNVYLSTARSMARFGLLMLNKGRWDQEQLLKDPLYFEAMVHPSQDLNKSYGYLWWLNGQESFMVPGLQVRFPGSYCPEAPADMYAGIGKNGQILCIVPSQNLIVLRMGESNGPGDEVSIVLCNQIWNRLNKVICHSTAVENQKTIWFSINPNPSQNTIHINSNNNNPFSKILIYNKIGILIRQESFKNQLSIDDLLPGIYYLQIHGSGQVQTHRFVKIP